MTWSVLPLTHPPNLSTRVNRDSTVEKSASEMARSFKRRHLSTKPRNSWAEKLHQSWAMHSSYLLPIKNEATKYIKEHLPWSSGDEVFVRMSQNLRQRPLQTWCVCFFSSPELTISTTPSSRWKIFPKYGWREGVGEGEGGGRDRKGEGEWEEEVVDRGSSGHFTQMSRMLSGCSCGQREELRQIGGQEAEWRRLTTKKPKQQRARTADNHSFHLSTFNPFEMIRNSSRK